MGILDLEMVRKVCDGKRREEKRRYFTSKSNYLMTGTGVREAIHSANHWRPEMYVLIGRESKGEV